MPLLFSEAELFVQFKIVGIMRNNSMNLFQIWANGSDVV